MIECQTNITSKFNKTIKRTYLVDWLNTSWQIILVEVVRPTSHPVVILCCYDIKRNADDQNVIFPNLPRGPTYKLQVHIQPPFHIHYSVNVYSYSRENNNTFRIPKWYFLMSTFLNCKINEMSKLFGNDFILVLTKTQNHSQGHIVKQREINTKRFKYEHIIFYSVKPNYSVICFSEFVHSTFLVRFIVFIIFFFSFTVTFFFWF